MSRISIEQTALKIAKLIAECRSEDPFTKVGAVGIRADKSFILAYNGAPSGVNIDWNNRSEKNLRVIHAESNLLRYCQPGEIETVVCTHSPCIHCLPMLAAYKIKRFLFEERYRGSQDIEDICAEFNIDLLQIRDYN